METTDPNRRPPGYSMVRITSCRARDHLRRLVPEVQVLYAGVTRASRLPRVQAEFAWIPDYLMERARAIPGVYPAQPRGLLWVPWPAAAEEAVRATPGQHIARLRDAERAATTVVERRHEGERAEVLGRLLAGEMVDGLCLRPLAEYGVAS